MRVLNPKNGYLDKPVDLFLGGGISNCPDWQSDSLETLSKLIKNDKYVVANPCRPEGLSKTGHDAAVQIAWEHYHIMNAKSILFWFPKESICPITLFELGVELGRLDKRIYIGTDTEYARRFDLIEQVSLVKDTVESNDSLTEEEKMKKLSYIPVVHNSLTDLLYEVVDFAG